MSATDYVTDGFDRVCDICGRPCTHGEFTVRDNVTICKRHPGYRRAKELDEMNARRRPFIVKPVKNTKPLNPSPTYTAEEGQIFQLVCDVAPFETFDTISDGAPGITGGRTVAAASWAIIYLLSVYNEGKRPAKWRTQALNRAKDLGDFLISVQFGNGLVPTATAATDERFGGLRTGTSATLFANDCGVGCAALCLLYRTIGVAKYLVAAKNAANFIVNLQATNLWLGTGATTVTYGAVAKSYKQSSLLYLSQFYPQDLVCLWACTLLLSVAGDGTYGAPGTVGGLYSAAPARLLSTSIAQQRAFWSTGAAESGSGTVINGFSASTPRAYFDGSAVTWGYTPSSNRISADNWAQGLYALFQVEGLTSQVTSIWDWLMGFSSESDYEMAAGTTTLVLLKGVEGTYSPATGLATVLDVSTRENASGYYDWGSTGLLAGIQASRNPSALAAAKGELGEPRHRTQEGSRRDGRTQYIGRLGRSGLSFQPFTDTGLRQESVTRASQVGLMYRYGQTYGSNE